MAGVMRHGSETEMGRLELRLLKRFCQLVARFRLVLAVNLLGRLRIPLETRRRLFVEHQVFQRWIHKQFPGSDWSTTVLSEAIVQPFQDLLNGPAGGDAYCGGVVFNDVQSQPELHHFRGQRAIDRPLNALSSEQPSPNWLEGRQFWCGPLAFHFGHQIADFGSRLLLSSLDPRGGELLWCPWRTATRVEDLLPWQQFLLNYLNPGEKKHRIATVPLLVRELVVVPQQARMRASPTAAHLEGLCWCERSLSPRSNVVVYVSRSRFAACTDSVNLLGAYAAEAIFEMILEDRGVNVIYPETLTLKQQLEIYLGSESLIVAEGSAQHGLELLGVHPKKELVVLCRRPQKQGMDLPLRARFRNVQFVQAIKAQWQASDGVAWDGLAILDWRVVAKAINPLLIRPITSGECRALDLASDNQLRKLGDVVSLIPSILQMP